MLKRFRQMKIPLAAKCQILFGGAVVLIVAAALLVPWQRMEQLTRQLNDAAAEAIAEQTLREHILRHQYRDLFPDEQPAEIAHPAEVRVRLLGAEAAAEDQALTRFERQALQRLETIPRLGSHGQVYDRGDGRAGYRYLRAVHAGESCLACHAAPAVVAVPQVPGDGPELPPLFAANAAPPMRPGERAGYVSLSMPSQVDATQLLLNRIVLIIAGLLAGTLAIVIFYFIITRLILQPVRVLQETAEKVSEGDLDIRSHISTGDEFQQLAETLNTMLSNLKQSEDQLRAINKSLDLKLNQLSETNLALYESDRLKSEFLANVSHELRTPLNSILGFAELLKDAVAAPAEAKSQRYIQNILNSGQNLLDLINDLLDLAKIEAGRMEVRSEPLSLSDLFEGLTGILKPLCEEKQLEIRATVAPAVPIIHTDPAKLQQVLYNFLSNAIKFSPPGQTIDLSATRVDDQHIRIAVTDRGPGISHQQQSVIFEKFRQIDASATRQHSGTGLGLAISREMVGLMHGTIGVQSEPGQGATFWLILPLRITPGPRDVRQIDKALVA